MRAIRDSKAGRQAMAHDFTIRAADGCVLGASRYRPEGAARGRIVLAGATGVGQRFYRHFAEHAAVRGFAVLTFDYRGVGRSAPPSLKGFKADFLDWARLDLAAALDAADGAAPLFLVGHSWGGHAYGLLPDPGCIAAACLFGLGTGWHGFMPRLEALRVRFLWRVAGPLLVRTHGYLAWRRLGMGEDLPLGVYRQWKRWCRHPRFFLGDPDMRVAAAGLARVRAPILAVNAVDDRWAPPASRDAFMPGYRNAPWLGIDVATQRLGHMGYFRPAAHALWDSALDWFAQDPAARQRPLNAAPCAAPGAGSARR